MHLPLIKDRFGRPTGLMLAWPQEVAQVKDPVQLFKSEKPQAKRCPFCNQHQVLYWRVVWYREWSAGCCGLCARTVRRLVAWTEVARQRWLQHRAEWPQSDDQAPSNMEVPEGESEPSFAAS